MKRVSNILRLKRYKVKSTAVVDLIVESSLGQQLRLKLDNCSLSGIAGYSSESVSVGDGFNTGDIVPAAKLCWHHHEITLGRLVVRNVKPQDSKTYFGFSTVDTKVPVDGDLSQLLEIDLAEQKTAYDFELNPDHFSTATFNEANYTNVDLLNRTKEFSVYFQDWKEAPKFAYRMPRLPSQGSRIQLERKRKNGRNDYIIMGSNDYLGMASNPDVVAEAKKALDEYGFGSTGSPLTTGTTKVHVELGELLARIFQKEAALLFNSGYTANVGILSGLTQIQDLIVADFLSHASIRDGMLMTKATSRFFKHNDPKHLDKILSNVRNEHAGCLVVTEGVFSMDGDIPPLKEIVNVARKHNARVMIDEAHSFGVVGPRGLGTAEYFNLQKECDIIMGTFSKIAGAIGGFVVGSRETIDWIWWFARSHVFTVSIPPSTAAAAKKAIEIFLERPELLQSLKENVKHFVSGLRELGFDINPNHSSAVVPVLIGDEKKLGEINSELLEAGVYCVPIVFPAVARNACRFRFTVMATHTIADLDYVLLALEKAIRKCNLKPETQANNMVDHLAG